MYVRFPLSLRNVEDLLLERGIDVSHETIRAWWNKFGPLFVSEIKKKRAEPRRNWSRWCWPLDSKTLTTDGIEDGLVWREFLM